MRQPPLAHCTVFLVEKQLHWKLSLTHRRPNESWSVSDKMYFNQNIIVINNRLARGENIFTQHYECLFFTWLILWLFCSVREDGVWVWIDWVELWFTQHFENKIDREQQFIFILIDFILPARCNYCKKVLCDWSAIKWLIWIYIGTC